MLLKKDVERCYGLANRLRMEYKKRGDSEMEKYYLGVAHASSCFFGRKTDTWFVDEMENLVKQLRKEKENV